ncbi:MAG: TrbI/VirB10 family protein [Phenylobacterium sp.]|uniref:TrbI/VirB10 family protein n=1 Tax=Phenylobacterium sp. TaxID=1871053 RepID=UPI001819DF43|nr:TrbI/VirB10 family protein [Phenylobacterium sp.]MBA4794657.1 TrbI/VirB10 family protein [Phenylobacterium sp.]
MTAEERETAIDHGRGVSPIAGAALARPRPRLMTLAALGVGAGLILLAPLLFRQEPAEPPEEGPARQVVRFDRVMSSRPDALAQDDLEVGDLAAAEAGPVPLPDGAGPADQAAAASPATAPAPSPEPSPAPATSSASPLLVYSAASPTLPQQDLSEAASEDSAEVAELGHPQTLTAHRIDRRYALLAGATMPCVLLTAIESTTPGLVTCSLARDVMSEDGTVVLLEKGSRVLGAYQEGLDFGERRLFVLWTRVVTPKGVAIALRSPAADALGRAGVGGALQGRFWERFGGALLLSLVDAGGEAVFDPQTGRTILRPSSQALEKTTQIGPRLTVPQGRELTIFVAHDLDFTDVYELALR